MPNPIARPAAISVPTLKYVNTGAPEAWSLLNTAPEWVVFLFIFSVGLGGWLTRADSGVGRPTIAVCGLALIASLVAAGAAPGVVAAVFMLQYSALVVLCFALGVVNRRRARTAGTNDPYAPDA